MTVGHLLFVLTATGYLVIGTWFEERDLRAGIPEYDGYRSRVPAVIPIQRRQR